MATRQPMSATGLGSVKLKNGEANGSQTWTRGAVLVNSSNRLSEGGANPTDIVGIATHGVTSATEDDLAQYVPALPGLEFLGNIDDSSDLGNGAIAVTDRYARYGITEDTNGTWYVDKNKSTDALARVTVTDFVDAVGETQGRVKFVFHQHGDLGGTPLAITVYAGSV